MIGAGEPIQDRQELLGQRPGLVGSRPKRRGHYSIPQKISGRIHPYTLLDPAVVAGLGGVFLFPHSADCRMNSIMSFPNT